MVHRLEYNFVVFIEKLHRFGYEVFWSACQLDEANLVRSQNRPQLADRILCHPTIQARFVSIFLPPPGLVRSLIGRGESSCP
ncbi:hypothetical protein [Microseira sp. BLCC-F43]|uniref:hypothetical protein n=1 Tax=Microseira sp. BLCC-F43 TaxID=3153602 RepID=UPI0035B8E9D9